jgi:DNA-binding transcriptional LysR family regulator
MKTTGLTLSQLRLFVAVADEGSFSAAAAALGMSQSSLSEGVQGLERSLGQPLLRRSPAGVTLTLAGERALSHARLTLEAAADLHLAVNEQAALSGTLKVATYRSLGMHLLVPVLAALRASHPALEVRILDADTDEGGAELVQGGQADVGLIQLRDPTPLLTWPLLTDEYLAVLPAGRGLAPVEWAEFSKQPFFLPGKTCGGNVIRHLQAHGELPLDLSEISDDDVIFSMVEHGLGLAILPRLAVLPLRPGLVALPLPLPLYRTLGTALKPGRAGLPHIHALIQAIRGHLSRPQSVTTPEFALSLGR